MKRGQRAHLWANTGQQKHDASKPRKNHEPKNASGLDGRENDETRGSIRIQKQNIRNWVDNRNREDIKVEQRNHNNVKRDEFHNKKNRNNNNVR